MPKLFFSGLALCAGIVLHVQSSLAAPPVMRGMSTALPAAAETIQHRHHGHHNRRYHHHQLRRHRGYQPPYGYYQPPAYGNYYGPASVLPYAYIPRHHHQHQHHHHGHH